MKENKKIVRSLCLSGGGSKGAWAGGLIQQMIEERGYDWDMYFGTSTGSLLITLIPLQKMYKLKEAYTSVTNKDIFNVDPFSNKGKLNWLNAVWRTIRKENSLGESYNLEKKIRSFFSKEEYAQIQQLGKVIYPCATEYEYGNEIYTNNLQSDYDTYVKFTRASASVPIAMDPVYINGSWLLDGGVVQHAPIQKAIDEGSDEIDIVILREEHPAEEKPWNMEGKIWFDVMLRTIDIMNTTVSKQNVIISQLTAKDKDVKLRFRYTPYKLTDNSLMFDKEQMLKWWQEGYEFGRLENMSNKFVLKKT